MLNKRDLSSPARSILAGARCERYEVDPAAYGNVRIAGDGLVFGASRTYHVRPAYHPDPIGARPFDAAQDHLSDVVVAAGERIEEALRFRWARLHRRLRFAAWQIERAVDSPALWGDGAAHRTLMIVAAGAAILAAAAIAGDQVTLWILHHVASR